MMTQRTVDFAVILFLLLAIAGAAIYVTHHEVNLWLSRRRDRRAATAQQREANLIDAKREVYVYDMRDGVPVNYRAAYPLLRVSLHVDRMTRELSKMADAFAGVGIFAERAAKALESGPW